MSQNRSRRIIALTALGFCIFGTLSGAVASDALADAKAMLAAGDYASAISTLDVYLQSDPKDVDARFTRAIAYARAKRNKEAIKEFSALASDLPASAEPLNNMAAVYAAQGDLVRAHAALESALRRDPNSFRARINLGDVYLALAKIEYGRALTLDGASVAAQDRVAGVNRIEQEVVGGAGAAASSPGIQSASSPEPIQTVPTSADTETGPPTLQATAVAAAPTAAVSPAQSAPAGSSVPTADAQAQQLQTEVEAVLQSWAQAWSDRNVDRYLSFYASSFKPENGASRSQWEERRRENMFKMNKVAVRIVNPKLSKLGEDRVQVSFLQDYRSAELSERSQKLLQLRKVEGSWKIVREAVQKSADQISDAEPPKPPPASKAAEPVIAKAASEPALINPTASVKPVGQAAKNQEKMTASAAAPTQDAIKVQDTAKAEENSLIAFVKRWVEASAQGDAGKYLALYSAGFQPSGGISRGKWLEQTRQYLASAKRSKLTVSGVRWQKTKDGTFLQFQQDMQDQTGVQHLTTTMQLVAAGKDDWRIMREVQK
jgi:ketosteroid isomerase-like protein